LARRSLWGEQPTLVELSADVWLGDSLGEMALYYGLSDAALLGGSFAPLGGQNLIEAAACGCPVFLGPHTFNFDEAASLALEAGAALRCADMTAAVAGVLALLREPGRQQAMARAASRFAKAHRGATARTRAALAVYLD
jgi:3-deoxy-D-manno-octulosonic-acid transferase